MIFRALSFYSLLIPITIAFALLAPLTIILPHNWRYWLITRWSYYFIFSSKYILGIDFQINNQELIKKYQASNQACIVVANHQSMWDAVFMQVLLPRQTWILKRELLRIPFFGWGLACLNPIAINRSSRLATQQVLEQGGRSLNQNIWVVIFPEGTRVAVDKIRPFKKGAANLAHHTQYPVITVAHNAGLFWPKGFLPKQSGVVQVIINGPIEPGTKAVVELTQEFAEIINSDREIIRGYS